MLSSPPRIRIRTDASLGKAIRMARIMARGGATLMVPLDDALIFGPTGHFLATEELLTDLVGAGVDSVLAFPGTLQELEPSARLGRVLNSTASTVRAAHTRKVPVLSVQRALALGADAVAVHVNVSSSFESEMLETLGTVVEAANSVGLPVLAIAYPRSEGPDGDENYLQLKVADPTTYSALVAHACRVAHEMGADIVKTQYTGTPASFEKVVEACGGVPVLVAGGPLLPSRELLVMARDAVAAGAAGVSFGRNMHQRAERPLELASALKSLLRGDVNLEEALRGLSGSGTH